MGLTLGPGGSVRLTGAKWGSFGFNGHPWVSLKGLWGSVGFSEGDGGHWGSVGVIGGSVRISVQYIYTRKGELLNLFILEI